MSHERDFYIIIDHPNGPTLATAIETARYWLQEGHRVVRVSGTERVTKDSLAIDEYQRAWATPPSSNGEPK